MGCEFHLTNATVVLCFFFKGMETQIKTAVRYHLTLLTSLVIKISDNKYWRDCEEKKRSLIHY